MEKKEKKRKRKKPVDEERNLDSTVQMGIIVDQLGQVAVFFHVPDRAFEWEA